MKSEINFVKNYFDKKTGKSLRKSITPNWNSTKHHLKLLKVPKNISSVVEIGCGIGRLLKEISDSGVSYCVGFDASESMIKEGKKYVGKRNILLFKVEGNGKIDYSLSNYFDYAFSIITFQHIPNTNAVKNYLKEMYLMLKKGGKIRFQLLAKDEFPKRLLWSYHDPKELMKYLKKLGFKEIKLEPCARWVFIEGTK